MPLYLNTDLELRSSHDLTAFSEALGERAYTLHEERDDGFFFTYELCEDFESPAHTIAAWCDLLESLPDDAKSVWRECNSRSFDIGLESGPDGNPLATQMTPDLLARLVALDAVLAFTLYPVPDPTEVSRTIP